MKLTLIISFARKIWRRFLEFRNSLRTALIIIFNFSIVLFFSCSFDKSINIKIIDPGRIIEKKMTLSDIANEIIYIPISNEILCGEIYSELTDSLIFIKPSREGLLAFDIKGKFKSRIGKQGRGPEEYLYASKFTFDAKNETVYILDINSKLLKYSMNGDFVQEIQIKNLGQKFFSEIIFSNNKLYLFEGINQGEGKFDWVVLDTLGNILFEKFNAIEKFPSFHGLIGNKQEAYNNYLYYWNQINDTIFKINDGKYEPSFLFAKGDFRFPKQKIGTFSTKYFFPYKIFFTKDYLFITYNYQFQNCMGIYIISEQQLYVVGKTKDNEFPSGPGIVNDIDGGLPIIPTSYYKNNKNEEFLVGDIKPFQLKAYVSSKAFLNSKALFPEKKKELEQLTNSLDENDNPVLMLVKLKDD
jgi:hypothetical protein